MSQALTYLNYIFSSFTDFVFNDLEFFTGVTFGWVCVACIVFGMLIKSILNIPRTMSVSSTHKVFRKGDNNG